jgi:curved DNA-binding protein CbpA
MSFNFNLYEELEISKKASQEEIKKAYRKLAMVELYNYLEMAS